MNNLHGNPHGQVWMMVVGWLVGSVGDFHGTDLEGRHDGICRGEDLGLHQGLVPFKRHWDVVH
jgi:hypothetical protein